MNNPMFSSMPNQQFNWFEMLNQVRSSKNPDEAMQNILYNTPEFQNITAYIKQNGGDAKTAFYNMAAQKGVDPKAFLQQFQF